MQPTVTAIDPKSLNAFVENLFVESTRQSVRGRLQLSIVLHAVPGKATIRVDHH